MLLFNLAWERYRRSCQGTPDIPCLVVMTLNSWQHHMAAVRSVIHWWNEKKIFSTIFMSSVAHCNFPKADQTYPHFPCVYCNHLLLLNSWQVFDATFPAPLPSGEPRLGAMGCGQKVDNLVVLPLCVKVPILSQPPHVPSVSFAWPFGLLCPLWKSFTVISVLTHRNPLAL